MGLRQEGEAWRLAAKEGIALFRVTEPENLTNPLARKVVRVGNGCLGIVLGAPIIRAMDTLKGLSSLEAAKHSEKALDILEKLKSEKRTT